MALKRGDRILYGGGRGISDDISVHMTSFIVQILMLIKFANISIAFKIESFAKNKKNMEKNEIKGVEESDFQILD